MLPESTINIYKSALTLLSVKCINFVMFNNNKQKKTFVLVSYQRGCIFLNNTLVVVGNYASNLSKPAGGVFIFRL